MWTRIVCQDGKEWTFDDYIWLSTLLYWNGLKLKNGGYVKEGLLINLKQDNPLLIQVFEVGRQAFNLDDVKLEKIFL